MKGMSIVVAFETFILLLLLLLLLRRVSCKEGSTLWMLALDRIQKAKQKGNHSFSIFDASRPIPI